MDSSNLTVSSASSTSASSSSNTASYYHGTSALDTTTNALQAAYLAAIQMQSQLQQQSQQQQASAAAAAAAATAFPLLAGLHPDAAAAAEAERILTQAALAAAAQVRIPSSAGGSPFQDSSSSTQQQQQQQQQQHPLSPPSHQTSAFSPPRAAAIGGSSINATAPSRSQFAAPSTASLDMMLLQMQMAAAAAGLVQQTPFNNLLSPSSVLGLLAPHFRLQSSANTAALTVGSLPFSPNASAAASLPQLVPSTTTTITSQQSLIGQQTSGGSSIGNNDRPSSSLPGSPSKDSETSPSPLPRCHSMGKQQKDSLKRLHSDMVVLRSLCDDTEITDDVAPLVKKRSKSDEKSERDRRLLAAEVMASIGLKATGTASSKRRVDNRLSSNHLDLNDKERNNSSGGSLLSPKAINVPTSLSEYPSSQIPSGDPNSPNRHHPLNHRPPAMEARFLECMAAIALHSNFPLPTAAASSNGEKEDDSSASSQPSGRTTINDENATENRSETKSITPSENSVTNNDDQITVVDEKLDVNDEKEKDCSMSSQDDDKRSQNGKDDEVAERLMHKSEKRTWPTTAIDDELCKELENYKGTDVPMIHAYVIPPRSDTSSSSGGTPDDRTESPPFHSVPSLAVPVPILNILLERILHTMLQT